MTSVAVKVCGMRDVGLARDTLARGAAFIGMIHHASSPRHVSLREMEALCAGLPQGVRVGVVVEPDLQLACALWATGVDHLQVHLKHWTESQLHELCRTVPDGRDLWLAPAWPPHTAFPIELLPFASRVVVDTYSAHQVGGTGKTGDWAAFRRLAQSRPQARLILAGGLSPENIREAIQASGATCIDVNSGVEQQPGVKSPEKLNALFEILHARE